MIPPSQIQVASGETSIRNWPAGGVAVAVDERRSSAWPSARSYVAVGSAEAFGEHLVARCG